SGCAPTARLSAESSDIYSRSTPPSNFEIGSIDLIASSLTQCAPECSDCVFESHCGADPVYHHATQHDPVGIKPVSEFCARQKGVMGLLLDILDNEPENAAILRRWGGM